jgi:phage terminase large subunit-like protein
MAYPLTAKANSYARKIVSGKIPACIQVRQACQRHLDNLAESTKPGNSYPYKFDKNKSERILDFAQQMKHVKGKWAGQFFQLEPWQCFFMGVSFGWIRKEDGFRRFREIYSEIPRKNSKSTMAAIIGLYMFAMDGEQGAEVYSAATSEAQAFEIFRPAWKMTKNAPDFKECFNISQGGSDKNPGNIYSMATGSRFETVIGKPGDGSSPHAWLLDEFHEAKTEESYDTGKTGMGARSQPLMVVITTAGTNTAYPCYALRKNCEKVLSGELVNEELFALIYTIDLEDDWTDIKTWRKANPNYGVSIYADFLESQRKTAIQDPRKQNIIKCKHLNMWSNAGDAWMNMVEWNQCYDPEINIEQFHGKPVFIGLDLASKIDIAAKIYVFKKCEVYYVFSKYYIPEDRTFDEEHAHYAGWVHEGYIEATPGSRIDIDAIQESIKQDAKDFGLAGSENGSGEICNDPWNAQQLITNLIAENIACVEISQTVSMLSEPMKEIEALVKAGNLKHDGNPVTNWMIANVCCRVDKKDNIFPFKEGNENKIDGAVALITAMARAMYTQADESSVYNQRGVLVF